MQEITVSSWTWLEQPSVCILLSILHDTNLFTRVKAGIWDQLEGYIVTDLSFLAFVYEKYTANTDNLEEGLFKGKILLQVRFTRVMVAQQYLTVVCRATKLYSHLHPQQKTLRAMVTAQMSLPTTNMLNSRSAE